MVDSSNHSWQVAVFQLVKKFVYYALVNSRYEMRLDPGRIEVVSEEVAAILRKKTGAERLAMADAMFSSARKMLISHLRAEHPDWDEQQINHEAARRLSHGAI